MADLKRLEEVVGDKVSGYFYNSKKSNMKNKYILHNGDCLDVMKKIEDNSVDAIICDLPYGTTQNKWDSVIPLDELWVQYKRILKDTGVAVLFSAQPFTSALVMSNPKMFKYDWVWQKPKGTGHLNAKKQPMRDKEDVLVFYRKQCTYNPQMTKGEPYDGNLRVGKKQQTSSYGEYRPKRENNKGYRYPKQIQRFGVVERGTLHPTQKPIDLLEYLVKTYTNEGGVVVDNTMGSGTTGVACMNLNRKFIGIELDENYYDIAVDRIRAAQDDSVEAKESAGKRKDCDSTNLFSEQI